jgi:hypothetical protein
MKQLKAIGKSTASAILGLICIGIIMEGWTAVQYARVKG